MQSAPTPIIKTRVPAELQAVFLASNRGKDVHEPPKCGIFFRRWRGPTRYRSEGPSLAVRVGRRLMFGRDATFEFEKNKPPSARFVGASAKAEPRVTPGMALSFAADSASHLMSPPSKPTRCVSGSAVTISTYSSSRWDSSSDEEQPPQSPTKQRGMVMQSASRWESCSSDEGSPSCPPRRVGRRRSKPGMTAVGVADDNDEEQENAPPAEGPDNRWDRDHQPQGNGALRASIPMLPKRNPLLSPMRQSRSCSMSSLPLQAPVRRDSLSSHSSTTLKSGSDHSRRSSSLPQLLPEMLDRLELSESSDFSTPLDADASQ